VSAFASRAENTCNALLCEELRKLGLEAYFEEHFLTRFGTSKPDIHAKWKDTNYFIEAKQKPRKLVDAVSKAYTYQKRLQAVGPRAVFAVLYPPDCLSGCEMAVLLNKPPFYVYQSLNSLKELAQRIHSMITEPPAFVELNTTDAIQLLREAVSGISEAFAKVQAKDVEEIFGGRLFFETFLGVREEKEIPIEHLRAAASYLLVNQILFYQILAKEKKELIRYKEIDSSKLEETKELQAKYFSKVLLEDYKPIFGFDVASKIKGSNALEAVKVTIDAVNALSPESLGHDVLGKIFHNLIPFDLRKVIAAFYTSIQAGEVLATLAIDKSDAHVLDPACGSGTLLVSSYQRKRDLLEKSGERFSFKHHKRFVEHEITGVDIMPFAAHLAAVHLSLQAPLYTTDYVRVAIQDSTALRPGETIATAHEVLKEAFKQRKITEDFTKRVEAKHKIVSGIVNLAEQGNERPVQLGKVDLVIMNPPFTRFQRVPPEYKAALTRRFPEARYRDCVHGQLGLHGYFLLLADRFLKNGGRLAAVLPATTLSAEGFYPIHDIWLKDYSLEHIIVCEGRSAFSENVAVREILFVAQKTKTKSNKVAFSILKVSPDKLSIGEARSLGEHLRDLRDTNEVDTTVDSRDYLFKLSLQDALVKKKRSLFRAIALYRSDMIDQAKQLTELYDKSGKVTTFGEYLHKVDAEMHESPRGIKRFGYYGLAVVNKQSRALKKHDFWFIASRTKHHAVVENRFSHVTIQIPWASLEPNIRRYAGLDFFDISGATDYVVSKPFPRLEDMLEASDLPSDERKQALRLVRNGEWEQFVKDHSSNVTLVYRARITGARTHYVAFFSDSKMFAGGSFWSLKIPDDAQAKLVVLWWNTTLHLFQLFVERKETEGAWIWFDGYVMREFSIPDFTKMSAKDTRQLLQLFDKIAKTPVRSIVDQLKSRDHVRQSLDTRFLRFLGMPEGKINIFLEGLYSVLGDEIRRLQGSAEEDEQEEE